MPGRLALTGSTADQNERPVAIWAKKEEIRRSGWFVITCHYYDIGHEAEKKKLLKKKQLRCVEMGLYAASGQAGRIST